MSENNVEWCVWEEYDRATSSYRYVAGQTARTARNVIRGGFATLEDATRFARELLDQQLKKCGF